MKILKENEKGSLRFYNLWSQKDRDEQTENQEAKGKVKFFRLLNIGYCSKQWFGITVFNFGLSWFKNYNVWVVTYAYKEKSEDKVIAQNEPTT